MKFFKKYIEMKESNDVIKFFNWLIPYTITSSIIIASVPINPILGIIGTLSLVALQFALLDWMK